MTYVEPANYDIYLYYGDTWRRNIRAKDAVGDYYDLSGATVMAQIRTSVADPMVLMPLTVLVAPDQVTDKGKFSLTALPSAYPPNYNFEEVTQIGVWDLQITWPSGDVNTYLKGKVFCKGDVSR